MIDVPFIVRDTQTITKAFNWTMGKLVTIISMSMLV